MCQELRPVFAKGFGAVCHPGVRVLGRTASRLEKSALVVLGKAGLHWKHVGLLTEWIRRRKPGREPGTAAQPLGPEVSSLFWALPLA